MSDTDIALSPVMPSATPSDADVAAWASLPRDEQLRRLRQSLTEGDCRTATSESTMEILAEARRRVDAKHG